jgi:osmotically-inducible protein OsmY
MIDKKLTIKIVALLMIATLFSLSLPANASDEAGLQQRIQEQALRDEQLEGTQVTVTVKAGEVVLSGTVRLYSQKMRYQQIAWRTSGVIDVDNEIRVSPSGLITDRDIKSQVLNIMLKYQRFHSTVIEVSVSNGHVKVNGTFHDASDVLFLKHRIAEIEGVTRIEIKVEYAV